MTAILPNETPERPEGIAAGEPRTLAEIIADVQATNEPRLVTIDGEPQMVCLSLEGYRAMEAKVDYLETVQAVREAHTQSERGECLPAREALEELGRRHGILR